MENREEIENARKILGTVKSGSSSTNNDNVLYRKQLKEVVDSKAKLGWKPRRIKRWFRENYGIDLV